MPKPISFGKLDIELVSSMNEAQDSLKTETPLNIAILGDFSGKSNNSGKSTTNKYETSAHLSQRKPILVDRDSIDEVLARLKIELKLSILGKDALPVRIRLSELDDFHPDHLFEKLEIFQALKEMRRDIKDPSTFAVLAQKLQKKEKIPESSSSPEKAESSLQKITGESRGDLLDQILGESQEKPASSETYRATSEWDAFLQRIVTPYLVPDIEPQQEQMLASVDAATGELMRMILHHPDFQAIESAWRGVHFLVSHLETGEELKLYLIDLSKAELAVDILSTEDLRSTGIFKLLVEQTVETPGVEPWSVLTGIYTFDKTLEDAELLGRMAKIAKAAGAPFITAAHDHHLGCESLAETPDPDDWKLKGDPEALHAWHTLREIPEAAYLGLVLPRFLLRLPYGSQTDATELFDFEEMEESPRHNHYLWGNPSFACIYLLGVAFNKYGWNFQLGIIQNIEGLPLNVYKKQNESLIKPCAEVVLTERAAEAILNKGLMPLLSFQNQDTIRLARFQSLLDPLAGLAGRWTKGK